MENLIIIKLLLRSSLIITSISLAKLPISVLEDTDAAFLRHTLEQGCHVCIDRGPPTLSCGDGAYTEAQVGPGRRMCQPRGGTGG